MAIISNLQSRKRWLLGFVALTAVALASGLVVGRASSSSNLAHWKLAARQHGTAVYMNEHVARAARAAGLLGSSVRVASAIGGANLNAQLLEGRDASGTSAFAISSPIFQGPFVSLATLTQGGTNALVVFPVFGGSQLGSTDRATILGLTRDDVARVVAVLPNGTQREVPLTSHTFAYTVNGTAAVSVTLNAYNASGVRLQAHDVSAP